MKRRPFLAAAAALAALVVFNAIATPGFLAIELRDGRLLGSLVDVLDRAAPVAIVALGMSLVVATGGVDLSVGAVMAIAGAVAAGLASSGAPALAAAAAALAAGLAAGCGNGLLVSALSLQPIVATLTLMVAGRGVAQLLTSGQIVTMDDETLAFVGGGAVLGLPFPVVLALAALGVVALLARGTAVGLFVEATGDNEAASRAAGVDVRGVKLLVYSLSGVLAAVAGLVVASDIRAADANSAGLYVELDAILAVVIGGTALGGGRFSLAGAALGALVLQALTTTILTRGVPAEHALVVKAAAVLGVALLQSDRARAAILRRRAA